MLIHQVADAVEVLLLPPPHVDSIHRLGCLKKIGGHPLVVVIQIGVLRIRPVIRHAREGPRFVAHVRGRHPREAVGKMLAHAEAQSPFARRLLPHPDDVLLRTRRRRIPSRLILRIPHVEIIVMHAHADEILRASLRVQIHQMLGIPLLGLERRDDVLVSHLRWMPVMLHMKFVCRIALDVHAARIPVARLGRRLRTPVRPDPELRVAEPLRRTKCFQRFASPLKRPIAQSPDSEPDCTSTRNRSRQNIIARRLFTELR